VARHIGIVACSAEGAALCYRTIAAESAALMGEHMHPEITMHTFPLGEYMPPIREGDWQGVADLMVRSAEILAGAGADFCISPDNTIHEAFALMLERSPLPWLHIAGEVARRAGEEGYRAVGVTGTRYLMTGPVYPERFEIAGIRPLIPEEADRERLDEIIFSQLVYGDLREESRLFFNEVYARLKERGAEAAVMGCTEIPLLVDPADCPLPVLDSTRLLARAAIREALGG
jgi:aspartate racemase